MNDTHQGTNPCARLLLVPLARSVPYVHIHKHAHFLSFSAVHAYFLTSTHARAPTWPYACAPPSVREEPTIREQPTNSRLAQRSSSPCSETRPLLTGCTRGTWAVLVGRRSFQHSTLQELTRIVDVTMLARPWHGARIIISTSVPYCPSPACPTSPSSQWCPHHAMPLMLYHAICMCSCNRVVYRHTLPCRIPCTGDCNVGCTCPPTHPLTPRHATPDHAPAPSVLSLAGTESRRTLTRHTPPPGVGRRHGGRRHGGGGIAGGGMGGGDIGGGGMGAAAAWT